jgi:hypothetical protein
MFGLTGAFALFRARNGKRDWRKRILKASLIIAFIPALNAMFSLFNSQYYARWFYMPALILAMITMQMVENDNGENLRIGALATILLFLLMIAVALLPSRNENGDIVFMQMASNSDMFWRDVLGTAAFSAVLILIIFIPMNKMKRTLWSLIGVTGAGCVGTMLILINGSSLISERGMEMWKYQMLDTRPSLDDSTFCRIETDSTSTNYEMSWGIPTVHCFLSTVPGQIFNFYEGAAGITRTVESDTPLDRVGIRSLLSARYYVENTDINSVDEFENGEGTPDYVKTAVNPQQNGFTVFENLNYIPMGFTFDYYTSESAWNDCNADSLDKELVRVLILPDEVADSLEKTDTSMIRLSAVDLQNSPTDLQSFRSQCKERAATSCRQFSTSGNGFTAVTQNFDEEELVFFSVPNVPGLHAKVDGHEIQIITADFGLSAISVPAGVHNIEVNYFPANFAPGLILTLIGILIVSVYLFIYRSGRFT